MEQAPVAGQKWQDLRNRNVVLRAPLHQQLKRVARVPCQWRGRDVRHDCPCCSRHEKRQAMCMNRSNVTRAHSPMMDVHVAVASDLWHGGFVPLHELSSLLNLAIKM
jgi:hypothetical protein